MSPPILPSCMTRSLLVRRQLLHIRFTTTNPHFKPFITTSHQRRWQSSRMASKLPRLPVFEAIASHKPDSTLVVHSKSGRRFTYGELLEDVCTTKNRLCTTAGTKDMSGERVAFMVENSYGYVVALLAILGAKAIAVPLSPAFPIPELEYILKNCTPLIILSTSKFRAKALDAGNTMTRKPALLQLDKFMGNGVHGEVELDHSSPGDSGIMLYTSGTTNRPKGVVIPLEVMTEQAKSLVHAWEYSASDRLLHVLPLHHIHGTINAIFAPLFAGSSIEFLFPFNADAVWRRFAAPFMTPDQVTNDQSRPDKITLFTAVPTVYSRLIDTFKTLPLDVQSAARTAISQANLRLAMSGSAALPTPIKHAWSELSSGNVLLERFGMTEVGMALSCGLDMCDRVDGSVGWPLPGVQARLVDVETNEVIEPGSEVDVGSGRERAGEIQLRGCTIDFTYWGDRQALGQELVDADDDGGRWFRTGDVAVRRRVAGAGKSTRHSQKDWAHGDMPYFILGRRSADIIKSGGEKVSALEVEREMLSLPQVADVAVVAVPSGKWGQKVGAVVVLDREHAPEGRWTPLEMRNALRGVLVAYKIPRVLRLVDHIPRNAMGKINKKELAKALFEDDFSGDEM